MMTPIRKRILEASWAFAALVLAVNAAIVYRFSFFGLPSPLFAVIFLGVSAIGIASIAAWRWHWAVAATILLASATWSVPGELCRTEERTSRGNLCTLIDTYRYWHGSPVSRRILFDPDHPESIWAAGPLAATPEGPVPNGHWRGALKNGNVVDIYLSFGEELTMREWMERQ